MTKHPFTVIYYDPERNKVRHKQIRDYCAQCACATFEEQNPKYIVIEAGLGGLAIKDDELQKMFNLEELKKLSEETES